MRTNVLVWATAIAVLLGGAFNASAADWGLKEGSPDIKTAGPLAFGPDGIVFVGDTKSAAIFAIATGDKIGEPDKVSLNIDGVNEKVAAALGVGAGDIQVNDLAVNPRTGNVYLSLSSAGQPALVRIDGTGKISQIGLDQIAFAKAVLPDAPEDKIVGEGRRASNRRNESITDLAFIDGKVVVAGLRDADAPSSVRTLEFPFIEADPGTSLEIFHAAHGRVEDYAAVRAFVPFNIGGEPNLLMGFTCTPLVKLPLQSLTPGEKVRGTTVAELGNRNRPLDMIVYEKDGKSWLLVANSARGVMKVSTEDIDETEVTQPVSGGGTAGQPYETIDQLAGVVQLDQLNDDHAVVLIEKEGGSQSLKTVALP